MYKRGDLINKMQNKQSVDWSEVHSKKVLVRTLKAETTE